MHIIKVVICFVLFIGIGSSTKIITYQGVLDRIEDENHAIILIESEHITLVKPIQSLPSNSQVNMWFTVELREESYRIAAIDYKKTKAAEKRSAKLNRLLKNGDHQRD